MRPLIALVENDLPTNRAFARLLRAHGFMVQTYLTAESLLARTDEAVVDCMLLDIDLDGMSGLELQSQLLQQDDSTPVIFVTGSDDAANRARAQKLGCRAFLAKPVRADALVDAIRAAIAPATRTRHSLR